MIDNPDTKFSNSKQSLDKHWWQKIKELLEPFFREKGNLQDKRNFTDIHSNTIAEKTTIKDWIKAIDVLQPLVQETRGRLDFNKFNNIELEILGASTYLFHVDRLLVKIREHYLNFRYRLEQISLQNEMSYKIQVIHANESAEHCYHTILNLTLLMQKLPIKRLYSDEFTSQIHALELETSALGSAVRCLNQFAYQQDIVHLSQLEQDFLQTLQSKGHHFGGSLTPENGSHIQGLLYPNVVTLRTQSQTLSENDHRQFINSIIDIHEALKKCYVIARKSAVKESLDNMAEQIEELILSLNQREPEKDRIFHALLQVFYCIETLRFSTNRESRCSRNLFEKAKVAHHQLRKICLKNRLGQEFLKQIAIKRESLIRSK